MKTSTLFAIGILMGCFNSINTLQANEISDHGAYAFDVSSMHFENSFSINPGKKPVIKSEDITIPADYFITTWKTDNTSF
ncbi:MAG: hypothetical protein JKZ03_00400, partial [Flavobacteriaceae bacterium]|nr:hypothetical protein [Flavobacteriaceae bacterium]